MGGARDWGAELIYTKPAESAWHQTSQQQGRKPEDRKWDSVVKILNRISSEDKMPEFQS